MVVADAPVDSSIDAYDLPAESSPGDRQTLGGLFDFADGEQVFQQRENTILVVYGGEHVQQVIDFLCPQVSHHFPILIKPYSIESTSAFHDASMMFSETPMVPNVPNESRVVIITRGRGACAYVRVKDTNFIVNEFHLSDFWVRFANGHAQRRVERADRTGAFARRDEPVFSHVDFDRRFRSGIFRTRADVLFVVHDDAEALQPEMRPEFAQIAAKSIASEPSAVS